ncbi:MAG: CaiB/BaiF CoA-transferase family protein [Acidobacteriota bacterium]|nr:CaiB/BaiF CoA-transferase family protein [Acidobacteriota bacterium]
MGVLSGYRIVEFAGIGPAPMAAMLLSDMGAEVLRIDRVEESHLGIMMEHRYNLLCRGRRSVAIDLKHPEGREAAFKLIAGSHALIEGFRPGVMERLGLGPDDCLARNSRLVYGRVTGWGQDGPLAQAAGHDINYIALTGALSGIGERDGPPVPPLNLVGDFGGGGVYLALGLVAGILEAKTSGKGQVIDAAMVDGAASQMTYVYGLRAAGQWTDGRAENTLDGGAPNYRAYETRDGAHIAIGPVEPKFWAGLLQRIGAAEEDLHELEDRSKWPRMCERLAEIIRARTREEWRRLLEGSDVCFAPVLDMGEAPRHPHNRERQTFVEVEGVPQPAPAPRFSRTPSRIQRSPAKPGEHTREALKDWGFSETELDRLQKEGVIGRRMGRK